ncbi:hypothetical protein ACL02R_05005 [Streptomyces sp. MS19]|uniref:hypothetical protein n=1 Tax=Streptomyces sp. MS19 TaxID=3385972 RepID=UPI00399F62A5
MGIEGEQLVLDYLSRVGDLAHGTSMSAAQRAALVNRLRDDIHRARSAAGPAESRASVKRILGRMGSPEDVVAAAASPGAAPAPAAPRPSPPRTRSRPASAAPAVGTGVEGPAVPLPPQREPERGGSPFLRPAPPGRTYWPDGDIGRFRGGIEIPEMLQPPVEEEAAAEKAAETDAPQAAPPPAPEAAKPGGRRRFAQAALAGRRVGGFVELAAVALLVAGTVVGSLVPLGLGWAAAWWSPRLGRREAQWAALGMPALVAGAYALWIGGRNGGYWGEPLAPGEAERMLDNDWPVLLRVAALASAAFLLWRARRHLPPPAQT